MVTSALSRVLHSHFSHRLGVDSESKLQRGVQIVIAKFTRPTPRNLQVNFEDARVRVRVRPECATSPDVVKICRDTNDHRKKKLSPSQRDLLNSWVNMFNEKETIRAVEKALKLEGY